MAGTDVSDGAAAVDFDLPTRLVVGANAVDQLGELAAGLGGSKVFLVSDQGVAGVGHVRRAEAVLQAAGIEVRKFQEVRANPTTMDCNAALASLADFEPDMIIGLGGGSSLDVAKACNFLRAGGGTMEDYWGVGKARGTLVPMIMVPTTAGTGSETQSFALIGQESTHQKMACGDPQAAPRIAVLDPTLTLTLPREVTAMTGLDTIGHAVEAAVTKKRNVVSLLFAAAAFELANVHLPIVLSDSEDLTARSAMMRASAYGGVAIENSMLGAAHSLANPLTARCGLAHGHAVGLMLPHVVRFNAEDPAAAAAYAEFARMAHLCPFPTTVPDAVERLVARLNELLSASGVPRHLKSLGVAEAALPELAAEAAQQWTAQFNPRPVGPAEFETLLARAS